MIATMKSDIKMARDCEKHTTQLMRTHPTLIKRMAETDPRRYLGRGEKSEYPWKFVVRINNGCGGILISPNLILTANHCVDDYRAGMGGNDVTYDFQYGLNPVARGGRRVWWRENRDEDVALVKIDEAHRRANPEYYQGPFPEVAREMRNHERTLVAAGYGMMRVVPNSEYAEVKKIIEDTIASSGEEDHRKQFGVLYNRMTRNLIRGLSPITSSVRRMVDEKAQERGLEPLFQDGENLKIQHGCSTIALNSVTLMNEGASIASIGAEGISGIFSQARGAAVVNNVLTDCLIFSGNSGGPLLYIKGDEEYGITGVLSTASGFNTNVGERRGMRGGSYIRPEAFFDAIKQHDK
jgi:hypothetical protein